MWLYENITKTHLFQNNSGAVYSLAFFDVNSLQMYPFLTRFLLILSFDKQSGTQSPVALNIQVTCAPLKNPGMRGVFLLMQIASFANGISLHSGQDSP